MSASERLRELDSLPRGTASDVGVAFALRNALPEIVAVVEAAEEVVRAEEEEVDQYQSPGYYSALGMQADTVRPALAALEEKLSQL